MNKSKTERIDVEYKGLKEALKDPKIRQKIVETYAVETRLELGITFLQMIGKYVELLTDVARNAGMVWVHIGNTRADTIADYEAWKAEKKHLIEDARQCLDFIDSLPQDKDTKFCKKWLIEIIETLS